MAIKVALLGAGRMGRAAAKKIVEAGDIEIVAAYDLKPGGPVEGVKVQDIKELDGGLDGVDVAVDFTLPSACCENAKTISDAGVKLVVGTTGFDEGQMKKLKDMVEPVGAVISPNMSVGVNVFWQLVGEAAEKFKGYDIEVVEAHHRFKKDAPSGTALKAVERICEASGRDVRGDVVYGREGECPRREGEIGVHSIRAGDIVGEHTVIFSTLGERFEIRHQAHSRESFASGIPDAIRFIKARKGVYDMQDVLGLR
ncbi:MAG: 4-hydroxy-tetrahydrodipicolinate reductase [Candidatus Altiarchaeales archaeon]|nr:4-hydroxy-tetrahydrodipicolinate reductase [Candidatus Altiarchaeales archaeon]MBD3415977.1 4-hydroxy-tetrahydrodipicolinate reductase [Candidatus Altiarchaeales archaeon]